MSSIPHAAHFSNLSPIGQAVRITLLSMSFATATLGASPSSDAATPKTLDAVATQAYNIPTGPLGRTLASIAVNAGIALSFDPALTEGLTSPAITGHYAPREIFTRLLVGSGLEIAAQTDGSYTLRRAAAMSSPAAGRRLSADAQLPAVHVTAQREAAWGPMEGYRATRGAGATKMDVPVLETPQQVSTIGTAQIRDQAISNVAEAVRYSTGVRPADYGITDDDVSVRGFYLTGTGLYRDGMRLIHNGFMTNLEPYGLERLEVVHGPASVLYGQSAPGGLINAVTKRPHAGMQREVGMELGSHDRRQFTADIGGALNAEGTLLGRLTVLKREAGTQWDGLRADRTYVAPALTVRGERTALTLLAHYQKDAAGFIIPYYRNTPFGAASQSINVNGPGSGHQKRAYSLGYLLEHRFNDSLTLRQNLRYLDGNNYRLEMRNRGLMADQRSMARLAMVRPDAEKTLVIDTHVEARLRSGDLSHQVLAGLDYYHSKLDWRIQSLNGAVAPIDLVNPVYTQPDWNNNFLSDRALARNTQVGLYLQDQIKLGERWVFSLGGRYDSTKIDTKYDSWLASDSPTTTTRVDRRDSAFTGRAGAIYLAPNGLAPYVSFSTAFQPPLTTVTAVDANGVPYEPETAKQAEVGVRYAPTNAGYTLSAAVFDLRKRNVRTPSTINPRFDVQTGEVRSRGLELQGSGDLGGGFSVIGAYTYLNAKVTRSNNALEVGERPGATPTNVASLWVKYQRGPLALGLGARHISAAPGELRAAAGPIPTNDDYTLFDAMAAYDLGAWRLSLNLTNLTDKRYKAQCNTFRGGAEFCALGFARELRVAAAYRF